MTDNEIIKAVECCEYGDYAKCHYDCPYKRNCRHLTKDSLDLINRQKAEIERLRDEVEEKTETITFLKDQSVGWSIDFCNLKAKLNTAKSEAIKEFAERLKGRNRLYCTNAEDAMEMNFVIDTLVKEMTNRSDEHSEPS